MAVSLAAAPDSWAAKQNSTLLTDHMLTLLEVGDTPTHLALKPDGGQIFCSNFGSDSISTIDTQTNEVSRTDTIANHPVYPVPSTPPTAAPGYDPYQFARDGRSSGM